MRIRCRARGYDPNAEPSAATRPEERRTRAVDGTLPSVSEWHRRAGSESSRANTAWRRHTNLTYRCANISEASFTVPLLPMSRAWSLHLRSDHGRDDILAPLTSNSNMDGSTRMQGLRSAGPRRGMPTSPLDQRRWASWSSQSGPDGQQTDGLPQETRFRGLRPIDTSGYTGHWQHDQVNGMDGADGVDGVDGISETDGDHESQESLPQQTQNPYYSPYMREDEQISPSSRAPSHSFYRASDPAARSPGVERQFAVTQRPHAPQSSQGGSRRPSGSGGQGSGQRRR